MNIVIPMAGRGQRFRDAGIETAKPLIPVRGRPMYAWAVDSLPLALARRLIFICLEEHLQNGALVADIADRYGEFSPSIVGIGRVTDGQASSVLEARDLIDGDEPLLIYNADTHCLAPMGPVLQSLAPSVDGLLAVFRAEGTKWSFIRLADDGRVVETAEKRRISDLASTGLYFFRRGRDFVRHAEQMLAAGERHSGEFYVAPVYNRVIAAGGHVRAFLTSDVWAMGTPEDLAYFEGHYDGARRG